MLLLALTCRLAISRSERNDLSGDVPDALFALLCDLDRFDLRDNDKVDGKTLAGYLARGLTNLKDQTGIDASEKALRGMFPGERKWLGVFR